MGSREKFYFVELEYLNKKTISSNFYPQGRSIRIMKFNNMMHHILSELCANISVVVETSSTILVKVLCALR